jgi:hypothetical protein
MSKKSVLALAGALVLFASSAFAQAAWPNKPIKLVAPYPPGGQTEVVSRCFAEKQSGVLVSRSSSTTSPAPTAWSAGRSSSSSDPHQGMATVPMRASRAWEREFSS